MARKLHSVDGADEGPREDNSRAFVLSDYLEELKYDFRPYVDVHGVIPEPSEETIDQFRRKINRMMTEVRIFAGNLEKAQEGKTDKQRKTIVAMAMRAKQMSEKQRAEKANDLKRQMREAISELCSGTPSAEDLAKMPYRGQMAFAGWLVGVFSSPKLGKIDING